MRLIPEGDKSKALLSCRSAPCQNDYIVFPEGLTGQRQDILLVTGGVRHWSIAEIADVLLGVRFKDHMYDGYNYSSDNLTLVRECW